jgi:hypothetical protein
MRKEMNMSDDKTLAARQALNFSAFSRVKDLVRELEDGERRLGKDFNQSQIDFRLSSDEMAWFVAYKTAADAVQREAITSKR